MPRPRKPRFRKQTQCWYVEIDGKQHNLGKEKKEATRKYHELMASQPEPPSATQLTVILDKFLDWVQVHRPASYRWYKDHIESFDAEYPDLEVDEIKVHHVEEWSSKGKGKRGKITSVKLALNWAVEMEHIDGKPTGRPQGRTNGRQALLEDCSESQVPCRAG